MTTKAAMEFWIKQAWRGHNSGTRYPDDIRIEPMHSEYTHVIEYSAYEELKRQNEVLMEAVDHGIKALKAADKMYRDLFYVNNAAKGDFHKKCPFSVFEIALTAIEKNITSLDGKQKDGEE